MSYRSRIEDPMCLHQHPMLEPLDRSARAPRTKAPSSTSLRSPTQGFRRAARTFDDASSPSRTALSREGPDWPAPAPGTAGRGFPHRGFSVCDHSNMFADTLDLIGTLLVIGHALGNGKPPLRRDHMDRQGCVLVRTQQDPQPAVAYMLDDLIGALCGGRRTELNLDLQNH
jgi:hypothetical protein